MRAVIVAMLIVATSVGLGSAATSDEPTGLLPTTVAFTPHGIPGDTIEERTSGYRRLRDLGVSAIRLDLTWTDVEPVGEPLRDYDFTSLDGEVAAITGAGLRVIGLLGYGHPDYSTMGGVIEESPIGGGLPPFGIGSSHYVPPDDPASFAMYAAAVAAHFGDEIIAWEVWNEENEGWRFWFPHEDPAAYAELLCATADAVRRVDPATAIVFGGVFFPGIPPGLPGMSGPQFVREAYAARPGLGRCFDVLAYHPYPYPFTAPELEVPIRGSVLSAATEMREAMPPGDRQRPLWITEIGWPTHDAYGVSEEKQAEYVARMSVATAAQGIPLLNWYTYGDSPDPTEVNQEAHFGFFRADGSAKPAAAALETFTDVFAGAEFVADRAAALDLPRGQELLRGGGFAYEFARSDATVTALWFADESAAEAQGPAPEGGTAGGGSVSVELPVGDAEVEIIDHLGARVVPEVTDGRIQVVVSSSPQYVVVRPIADPVPGPRGETALGDTPVTGSGVGVAAIVVLAWLAAFDRGRTMRRRATRRPWGRSSA